jgi:uncharacterized protein with PhoU and TrkA domain
MRRLFWIALGAAAGIYAVRRLSKAAEAYSPAGLGRSMSRAADAARELADAVREGMAEREHELRIALGVDSGTMDGNTARHLLDDPTGP